MLRHAHRTICHDFHALDRGGDVKIFDIAGEFFQVKDQQLVLFGVKYDKIAYRFVVERDYGLAIFQRMHRIMRDRNCTGSRGAIIESRNDQDIRRRAVKHQIAQLGIEAAAAVIIESVFNAGG